MNRAEERAGPEDVGNQGLKRGLDTALPFLRKPIPRPLGLVREPFELTARPADDIEIDPLF